MKKHLFITLLISMVTLSKQANSEEKPNFVWLISEDNSKHFLSQYQKSGADMKNIDKLAASGVVFDQAYSNSPVCSTARSTLALGVYAPSYQMQNHRPFVKSQLPNKVKPLSKILKEQGYYTTNKTKEDYNFEKPEGTWDKIGKHANWRQRRPNQPFFHVQSFSVTHESRLHFPLDDMTSDSDKIAFQSSKHLGLLTDTPLQRYTYNRYLKQHELLDQQIGMVIKNLRQQGLLDSTFVFYFSDHGGALPGSKGYLNESGLTVPLVMHVPTKFKHLVDPALLTSNRSERLISFVDFAPSILGLASLNSHAFHQGQDKLSNKAKHNEDITYFYADRFDEKYDTSRAIRDGKFKYVFNFKPHYPQSLYNNYRYKQAAYQELAKLNRLGKLEGNGADFFQPKSMEALYDISIDPNELNNLAKTPEYANKTKALRTKLFSKMLELQDLALLPESFYINAQKTNNQYTVAELNALQKDLLPSFLNSTNFQNQHTLELLSSNNSWLRYWTIQRLHQQPFIAEKKQVQLLFNMMTTDTSPYVQSAAFELLSAKGIVKDTSHWQRLYDKASSDVRRLELLNIATYLYELRGLVFQPRDDYKLLRPTHKSVAFWIDKRWAYLTSDIAGR